MDSANYSQIFANSTTPPSPNIPYGTAELRRKVLEKVFTPSNRIFTGLEDDATVRQAFLDFVLNVPMRLDGLHIGRKAWAKAFYQSDIINSAKCLFEALFSEEEMEKCTLNGKKGTQELSAVKRLAILRASCWMKKKNQDPYLFNPEIPSHNVYPSGIEQDDIERKVFTERRSSKANRKNRKRQHPESGNSASTSTTTPASTTNQIDGDSDSQNMDLNSNSNASDEFTNMSISSPGGESSSSLASSSLSPHHQNQNPPPQIHVAPVPRDMPTYEFGELEALFYRFPEEFLDTLLPSWRESYIFIDGLLVETSKWRKAWEEVSSDPVKAAWTLFLALFTDSEIRKCTLNGKNGTEELCPVKKLAIIRAIEWMRRNQGKEIVDPGIVAYFDNDDEDCNVFPSKEDKERIETKVFTEKRYQQSRGKGIKASSPSSMSASSLSPNPGQHQQL